MSAGSASRGGRGDDVLHGSSVGAGHLDHGDLGRVSRQRRGEQRAVGPQQHDAAEPVADRRHQLVEVLALRQPAGDPHHRVVREQRAHRGVRVRRLRVVDVAHAAHLARIGDPVPRRPEAPQPLAYGGGVTPYARASAAAASAFATLCGAYGTTSSMLASSCAESRRPSTNARSTSRSSTTPSIDGAGHTEREPDRAAALDDVGLLDHPLGLGVGDVVDRGDLGALVDPGLRRRGRRRDPEEVDVVGCEVQARRRQRLQAWPGTAAAGHRPRPRARRSGGPSHHRVDQRPADVARPRRSRARRRAASTRASASSWSCRWCR